MVRVCVDAIISDENQNIVLVRRVKDPFKDMLVLPGGHLEDRELLKEAIEREVKEEVGISVSAYAMLGVYDDPQRDPRDRVISICYLCKPNDSLIQSNFRFNPKEIKSVELVKLDDIASGKVKLGFDHLKMIKTYRALIGLGKQR